MLKTAEIIVPQIDSQNVGDGKALLYEAFVRMVDVASIKDYPKWRRQNNKRWLGGLTAEGNIKSLKGVPYSVVLRESNGMVHLVAINKDVVKVDRAEDYKKDGWEFPESDRSILMLAKYYKRGENRGNIVITSNRDLEASVRLKEEGARWEELVGGETAVIVRRMAFRDLVKVIVDANLTGYPSRSVLTSPVWRAYNVRQDKTTYLGGARR